MRTDSFILAPGLFRLVLAYVVFVNHSIPLHLGSMAVYLFFMLSGYWVHVMWHKEYAATDRPYRNFILSRFWRLMPVYWLCLALLYAVDWLLPTGRAAYAPQGLGQAIHYYLSQLLVLGYAPLPFAAKSLPPVWSLDVELQFYLVAPLLITALARPSPARLGLHIVALLGFAAFLLVYPSIWAQSAFLPMYLVFFLVGLQAARHHWTPGGGLALGGLSIAGLLVAGCIVLPPVRPLLIEGSFSTWLSDYNPDANVVLALLLAPYAIATVRKPPPGEARLARLDRDLGNISYEIYLLHESALAVVAYFAGGLSKYQQLPALAAAWVALLPAAWLVYRGFDRPIDRLRIRFVRTRRRSAAVAAALPQAAVAR